MSQLKFILLNSKMLVRACVLATPHPFVFSQLTHPKNDLQIIYSYFDFEGRYVRCARQNHPGFDSKIMTTHERHLTYTKNKPKILLSSSYKTEEMALLCLQRKPLSIISILLIIFYFKQNSRFEFFWLLLGYYCKYLKSSEILQIFQHMCTSYHCTEIQQIYYNNQV